MNVLSVFDGMSCGQIALTGLGVKIDNYFAAEIDKHAIQVTQKNFPNTVQLGSVTDVKAKDLPKIDLFIGGSPCQGFSFAGKQLNFNDPRSALFFEFVRLWKEIKEINPNAKFLLENVNMKREYLRVISEYLEVFPVNINSNLVSAQNRNRWYWSNIRTKDVGLFSELWTDIPQPKDRGILLKDILQPESEIDEKYYLSDKMVLWLEKHSKKRDNEIKELDGNQKSGCLTATAQVKQNLSTDYIATGKVRALTTELAHGTGFNLTPNHAMEINAAQKNIKRKYGFYGQTTRWGVYDKDGISPTITASMGMGGGHVPMIEAPLIVKEATKKGYTEINPGECVDLENPNSKTRRGRKLEDKSNCLMSSTTQQFKYTEDYKLRRLTPIECERLQTVPDNYTDCVSDTQRYKMLGNGWTIEVIKHILSFITI